MFRVRRILAVSLPVGYYLSNRAAQGSKVNAKSSEVHIEPLHLEENLASPQDTFTMKLYGYNGCPYRGKVKAFLDYYGYGYEYECVEINPFTKGELKTVTPGYRKSPVLQIIGPDGQELTLKDSAIIVTALEKITSQHSFNQVIEEIGQLSEKYFELSDQEKKLLTGEESKPFQEMVYEKNSDRLFVDNKILHTVAPNIYSSYADSRKNCKVYQDQSPRWRDTNSGKAITEFSALAMWFVGSMVFKKYRESDDQTPRQYLYSAADKFIERKAEQRFLGGDWPNTADLEAYGILTTLNGTEVLGDLEAYRPIFYQWFTSMKKLVDSHHGRF